MPSPRHLAIVALASACTPPPSPLPTAGEMTTSTIRSEEVGVDYELFVYLPPGHDEGEPLPVFYALDGAWNAEPIAGMLEDEGVRAFVVGIGGEDRRDTDYLLPGARDYYRFLTTELIPTFETEHAVIAGDRILTGHSKGGLFTGLAVFLDRLGSPSFTRFVAQDGSFQEHPEATRELEEEGYVASGGSLPVTLILSGTYRKGNYPHVEAFHDRLVARRYADLELELTPYVEDHDGMFYPSFIDAVRRLFPDSE